MMASNEMSAARKLGTRTRIQTPRTSGPTSMATSLAVWRRVRSVSRSKWRKLLERAMELEYAAATPSSTSRVMKMRKLEMDFTEGSVPPSGGGAESNGILRDQGIPSGGGLPPTAPHQADERLCRDEVKAHSH